MNSGIRWKSLVRTLLWASVILQPVMTNAQEKDCSILKGEELIKCLQEKNRSQTTTRDGGGGTTGKTSGTVYPGQGK